MLQLVFNGWAIPRTTTREQWREIHRWKRMTEKKLREAMECRFEMACIYGTSHPEIMADYVDRAINPPVMFYPPLK